MNELIERYVCAVGEFLAERDRKDVQTELRSQIHDTLDDRFGATPSQDDVARVLTDLGDPARLALAYGSKQYLIGPELYPTLVRVLGYGFAIVPAVAVGLATLDAFTTDGAVSVIRLAIQAISTAVNAALTFVGITILIFFVLQRSGYESGAKPKPFNPLNLLSEGDPRRVDRGDLAFNIAGEVFGAMLMGYFFSRGGLPLEPWFGQGVIPVSRLFLGGLALISVALVALQIVVLVRARWSLRARIVETMLELAGVALLHAALFAPLVAYAISRTLATSDAVRSPVVQNAAPLLTISVATIIVIVQALQLYRLARAR